VADGVVNAFESIDRIDMPIETFYNFVDATEYDPEKFSESDRIQLKRDFGLNEGPVVLFVGRMIEQKGPHLALRAFKKIAARHTKAKMLFVGAPWYSRENDSSFVDSLKAEAEGIEDRIRFTGYINHAKMPSIYAVADICCVPSIWDDPSPFVTYEAQAMALPVICSPRGGIPEIVKDRHTARCFDPFNTPLFASVLDNWLSNPKERSKVGRAGRANILERFSLELARQKIEKIYEGLRNDS
jgi:glycosyltransferase involved in cell wall biosynthesis